MVFLYVVSNLCPLFSQFVPLIHFLISSSLKRNNQWHGAHGRRHNIKLEYQYE